MAETLFPEFEDDYRRKRDRERNRNAAASRSGRDIGEVPAVVDSDRRREAGRSFLNFCLTYGAQVFYLNFSSAHLEVIRIVERCVLEGGLFAMAMPRGNGKTALCKFAALWAVLFGYHRYVALIAATEPKARQLLHGIKTQLRNNPLLLADFPEVCFPIRKLENLANRAAGQLCCGESTQIEWTSNRIVFPTITKSVASGARIAVAGLTGGNIRGLAEDTADGKLLRPSLVIPDDPQTDESARSIPQCLLRSSILNGAVLGVVDPIRSLAALMPVTVIRKGDLADQHVNREIRPEWLGKRMKMVTSWPEGLTDTSIDETKAVGKLWLTYDRLRVRSLQRYEDIRLATKWYIRNRAKMDQDFTCSWPERFVEGTEVSAQQHAMNLRFRNGDTFCAEYQQEGIELDKSTAAPLVTAEQITKRIIRALPQRSLLLETQTLVALIDIQDEIFFYSVLGVDNDFTGAFVDYGTFPSVSSQIFTKAHTERWGLLSRLYWQAYPQHRHTATMCEHGYAKPPLDAKLYHALSLFVPQLLNFQFTRVGSPAKQRISHCGIDVRWGKANECLKRFVRNCGFGQVMAYMGQTYPPTRKQLEDYTLTKGWMFEHQRHPTVKAPKWVLRPGPDGQLYMSGDVDRLKDFLFERLLTPMGSKGAIAVFAAPPERHTLFASHVCDSEYPEPVSARGYEKNQYQSRKLDNDYLDCSAGCIAFASFAGACLRVGDTRSAPPRVATRKITETWKRRA